MPPVMLRSFLPLFLPASQVHAKGRQSTDRKPVKSHMGPGRGGKGRRWWRKGALFGGRRCPTQYVVNIDEVVCLIVGYTRFMGR